MRISHTRKSDTVPPLIGGSDWDDLHEVVDPLKPLSGQYYDAAINPVGAGNLNLTASQIRIAPIRVPRTISIDRLGLHIVNAVSAATMRIALYDQIDETDALAGWPGALLDQSPNMDASLSSTYCEFTLSRVLSSSRQYWVAVWPSANISVANIFSGARGIKPFQSAGLTAIGSMVRTIAYSGGSWPTTWGRSASELASDLDAAQGQTIPRFTWRVA